MKKIINILILLTCLITIKEFESSIFYDPLINFFKKKTLLNKLPCINLLNYILNDILRFIINIILCIGILYQIIKKKKNIFIFIILFITSFILIYPIHIFLIIKQGDINKYRMLLFITKKFIKEPLLFIIVFPTIIKYFKKIN